MSYILLVVFVFFICLNRNFITRNKLTKFWKNKVIDDNLKIETTRKEKTDKTKTVI